MSLKNCSNQRNDAASIWTAEEIDILIMSVRSQEELFDQSSPNYSNREVIDQIWHHIANQLNKTAKECCKKWQLLRAGYRKRRHSLDAPSGSQAKKIKTWAFFDSLTFIEPHMVERQTVTNIIHSETSSSHCEGFLEAIHSEEEIENNKIKVGAEMKKRAGSHYEISEEEEDNEERVNTQEEFQTKTPKTYTNQTPSVKGKQKENVDREFSNYLKTASMRRKATKEKSAIELFMLSCVDEANALSLPAQRIFKKNVIDLLSELSNDP